MKKCVDTETLRMIYSAFLHCIATYDNIGSGGAYNNSLKEIQIYIKFNFTPC